MAGLVMAGLVTATSLIWLRALTIEAAGTSPAMTACMCRLKTTGIRSLRSSSCKANRSCRFGARTVRFPENRENNREFFKSGLRIMEVLEGLSANLSCLFSHPFADHVTNANSMFNYLQVYYKIAFPSSRKPMPHFRAGVGWIERSEPTGPRRIRLAAGCSCRIPTRPGGFALVHEVRERIQEVKT